MSAPDHNDPSSKLRLRIRPLPGGSARLSMACAFAVVGAVLCLLAFLASFLPFVSVGGDRFSFLFGAVGFAVVAAVFRAAAKALD